MRKKDIFYENNFDIEDLLKEVLLRFPTYENYAICKLFCGLFKRPYYKVYVVSEFISYSDFTYRLKNGSIIIGRHYFCTGDLSEEMYELFIESDFLITKNEMSLYYAIRRYIHHTFYKVSK
jgi:hypothetical protein